MHIAFKEQYITVESTALRMREREREKVACRASGCLCVCLWVDDEMTRTTVVEQVSRAVLLHS